MKKLSLLLFMVIVAISGCEKEPVDIPIEELQIGDTYEDGIVCYIDEYDGIVESIEIMSLSDLGELLSTEVPGAVDAFKDGKDPNWHVPVYRELKHIIGAFDVISPITETKYYWFDNIGELLFVDANHGNNTNYPTSPDNGLPHWLRMHRRIVIN